MLKEHFAGRIDAYDIEVRMRHRDGHWVWVHDRGKVSKRSPDGKPLFMAGTHMDITETRRAIDRLAEQKMLADQSARNLEITLAHMKHGISVFDSDRRLVIWNAKYGRAVPHSAPGAAKGPPVVGFAAGTEAARQFRWRCQSLWRISQQQLPG